MSSRAPSLPVAAGLVVLAVLAGAESGCRRRTQGGQARGKPYGPVQALLMPAGTKEARLTLERRKTRTGKTTRMLPRSLVASRSRSGVVYRFRERSKPGVWRLAAQLFVDARPDGAWIRAQYGMGGVRVGARGPRLLFPWPPKPGVAHPVSYRITDGRKATGTVTVLRHGFSHTVEGKTYEPCLEVREVLKFGQGGGLDLRSTYCKGIGRVEIETHSDSLSKGQTRLLDRTVKLE